MTTDEQFKLFEQNLARKVEEHYKALVAALQPPLTGREQAVFAFAMSKYAVGGRWYDKWGVPDSVLDTIHIVLQERKDRGLVIPILALHDTGYPSLEDTATYEGADIRELHMRVGGQYAAKLYGFNNSDGYLFSRDEVRAICAVVAHHDDHYLQNQGVFTDPSLLDLYKTFVDCDRTFVPSFVSAYKDYVSRYAREKYGAMSGKQFLAMRVAYFFTPHDAEVEEIGIAVPLDVFQEAQSNGKYKQLHLATSQEIIVTHLKARKVECDAGLFRMAQLADWNAFENAAETYFQESILLASSGISYDRSRFST